MIAHRTSRYSRLAMPLALGFLLIAGAIFIATQRAEPEVLSGQASVIDGDTIRVAEQKVRLQGLAAPELDEPGGQAARSAMTQIVQGQPITCELDGTTSHDRLVGICYAADRDVAVELVTRGLARDCPRFSGGRYKDLETAAGQSLSLPAYCSP